MISTDQLLSRVALIIEELFEVPAADVRLESKLADDLDLDSIDAVDLIARLETIVGRRVEPAQFKGARTIGDVVTAIQNVLSHSPILVDGR